jgi:hypothetical protein
MSNQTKIANATELNSVIFRETANAPFSRKFVSLFPGLGYAAGYKVGNRGKMPELFQMLICLSAGSPEDIQVWRPAHRQGLPWRPLRQRLRAGVRQEDRQGHHALHGGQVRGRVQGHRGEASLLIRLLAHSLIGIGEIVLLPLDVLKIKRQTNPEAFRGRGVFKIVADEGFGLYRGWGWTAARNAPGSFAVRQILAGDVDVYVC